MDAGAGPVSYAAYIAPGLLATSAMNGALYDSTVNVFFKMRYAKLYDAMLATSLGPMDVALGEIAWSLLRGGIYPPAFVLVMLVMGLLASWWARAGGAGRAADRARLRRRRDGASPPS